MQTRRFSHDWLEKARTSDLWMFAEVADTLSRFAEEILAHYDGFFSTDHLEGINNKIKTHNREVYSYREKEFLKLLIYAIHQFK